MNARNRDRVIRGEVIVDADLPRVWDAWTTDEGITSFFAPACNLDLHVDGLYEILFDPEAEPGRRGAEGMRIMTLQPKKMLSFTWSAPPHIPNVRDQRTHVVIRFNEIPHGKTRVTLTHDGWGEGPEWDDAFDYFERAWNEIVLPRLKHCFSTGPIHWENPPM